MASSSGRTWGWPPVSPYTPLPPVHPRACLRTLLPGICVRGAGGCGVGKAAPQDGGDPHRTSLRTPAGAKQAVTTAGVEECPWRGLATARRDAGCWLCSGGGHGQCDGDRVACGGGVGACMQEPRREKVTISGELAANLRGCASVSPPDTSQHQLRCPTSCAPHPTTPCPGLTPPLCPPQPPADSAPQVYSSSPGPDHRGPANALMPRLPSRVSHPFAPLSGRERGELAPKEVLSRPFPGSPGQGCEARWPTARPGRAAVTTSFAEVRVRPGV